MIMEFLALAVPPLIILFALAMEAVEDRLLRRKQPARRAGARADQRGDPAPRREGPAVARDDQPHLTSVQHGCGPPTAPSTEVVRAQNGRPHPDRARQARRAAG